MKNNLLTFAVLLLAFTGRGLAADRPNILIIFTDDQGYGDVGCYGNDKIKTPHQDTLASQGTLFTRAFCTTASCSASRSAAPRTGSTGGSRKSLPAG